MAISVTLYTFSKKINSTAQPTGGTAFDCVLKAPCGVVSPRIALNISGSPAAYNYAYIPSFSRYYFVHEWTWEDGLWVAYLNVDALASWKTQIGNQFYYCLRTTAGNIQAEHINIIDTLYPIKPGASTTVSLADSPFAATYAQGRYIVSTFSDATTGIGGMSTYVLTESQFQNLRKFMFGSTTYLNIDVEEMTEGLQKIAFNPGEYVLSCRWLPFSTFRTTESTIKFGWWDSGIAAGALSGSSVVSEGGTIDVPKHPLAATRGAYLKAAPFSTYSLFAGPFGTISIDPNMIYDINSITWQVTVDAISGNSLLTLSNGNGIFAHITGSACIEINLGSLVADVSGIISNPLSGLVSAASAGVSSLFTGGNVGQSIIDSTATAVVGKGGSGKGLLGAAWALHASFLSPVEENFFENGRVVCTTLKPTASNYYVMGENHVSLPCTDMEIELVKSVLMEGFYYE